VPEEAKEAGMLFGRDCLSNYLYVLVTYGIRPRSEGPLGSMMELFASPNKERGSNPSENGTPASEDESEDIDMVEEVAAFHDSLYGPSEQSLAIRIKAMIRRGKVEAASNLLNNVRLHSYSSCLKIAKYALSQVRSTVKSFKAPAANLPTNFQTLL
jgi:hypothetical protein